MNKEEFINHLKEINKGLSIIITAYNSQDFIEECLDSIQNQTYFKYNDKYEILLGIDACEKTLKKVNEIRKKYKNLKVFYASENGGTYRMRNSLWIRAKYDNLLFFDSDDVMPEDFIGGNMKYIGWYDLVRYYTVRFHKNINYNDKDFFMAHGSILVKKIVLNYIKGFYDERIGMDTDLINRIEGLRFKIYENNNNFFFYRQTQNQLTSNKKTGFKSEYRKKVNTFISKRKLNKIFINNEIKINNSLKRI